MKRKKWDDFEGCGVCSFFARMIATTRRSLSGEDRSYDRTWTRSFGPLLSFCMPSELAF